MGAADAMISRLASMTTGRRLAGFAALATWAVAPAGAPQQLWRSAAAPRGPCGERLAVICGRDGDGHDDIVASVYVPLIPGYASPLTPEAWFFSGRTGQVIGQGPRTYGNLVSAGD